MLSSNHFLPSQLQPITPMLLCTLSWEEFMGMIFSGMPLPPHLPWAPGVNPTGDLWPSVPMYWSFLGSLQCQRLDHWFVKECCNEVFISRAPTVQWSRVHFQKRTHSIHPEWQGFSLHAKHPGRGENLIFIAYMKGMEWQPPMPATLGVDYLVLGRCVHLPGPKETHYASGGSIMTLPEKRSLSGVGWDTVGQSGYPWISMWLMVLDVNRISR